MHDKSVLFSCKLTTAGMDNLLKTGNWTSTRDTVVHALGLAMSKSGTDESEDVVIHFVSPAKQMYIILDRQNTNFTENSVTVHIPPEPFRTVFGNHSHLRKSWL